MESELAACPVCGEGMLRYDPPTEPVVWCSEPDCRYSATTAEAHEALARRCEVGRLVMQIANDVGDVTVLSRFERGYRVATSEHGTSPNGDLLDALRALAKECQLPEKP